MKSGSESTKFISPSDSKISQSCDLCKSKKIKCDQKKPSCNYCIKRHQECIYSERRKPGLKAGYGQKVLERLNLLEEQVKYDQMSTSSDIRLLKEKVRELEATLKIVNNGDMDTNAPSVVGSSIDPNSVGSSNLPKANTVPLDIRGLVNHTSEDSGSSHPNPGTSGSIDSTTSLSEPMVGQQIMLKGLPPFEQAETLFRIYLEKILPIFPIIHPSVVEEILKTYDESPKPQVYGIVLCALRYEKTFMNSDEKRHYYSYCKDKIFSTSFNVSNIDKLQAMSLLAFDLYGISNNPDTWSVIAIISSGVRHLNLLSEKSYNISFSRVKQKGRKRSKNISTKNVHLLETPCSWLEEESRRNLFWEIYVLSHLSSVSNAFSCSIPEDEIRCLLPVKLSSWMKSKANELDDSVHDSQNRSLDTLQSPKSNENLYGSNSYLIEIIHILGKVQSFMSKPVDLQELKDVLGWQMQFSELESEIGLWRKYLPNSYNDFLDHGVWGSNTQLTRKDILFHALYHTMIIRLNSAAGYPYFNSNYFQFSKKARAKCSRSVESVISLSKKLPNAFPEHKENIYELCGPQYAFALWVSSRVLLVNAINTGTEPPKEINFLINILEKIGNVWECASKYAEILNFLITDETEYHSQDFSFKNQLKSLKEADEVDSDSYSDCAEDPNGRVHFHSNSATIISDMRLTSYALDVLLTSKIERFKKNKLSISPNNSNDISNLFEWFKLPINNFNDAIIPTTSISPDEHTIFNFSN